MAESIFNNICIVHAIASFLDLPDAIHLCSSLNSIYQETPFDYHTSYEEEMCKSKGYTMCIRERVNIFTKTITIISDGGYFSTKKMPGWIVIRLKKT